MRKWIVLSLLLSGFGASACCEEDPWGDDWDGTSTDGGVAPTPVSRATTACYDYCDALIACDFIASHSHRVCLEYCVEAYEDDELAGITGTHCIANVSCEDIAEDTCGFSPIPVSSADETEPKPLPDPNSNPGMGGGGTSEEPAPACTRHHDCALDQDCVGGACLSRCAASCQCDEGLACEEGYCQLPEVPARTCVDDCDCTSGQRCEDGSCR